MTTTLDAETEQLALAIAAKTGEGINDIVKAAVEARARAVGIKCSTSSSDDRFKAMLAIAQRAARRPVLDPRSADEIIGYNDRGLPA